MGTKKGQRRKTARRAYKGKKIGSVTTGRPRQASTETLRRGDQWEQPSQVASTSAILDQIRAAVEAGLISPARAKELLMRLQGSMPPQ